jgi:hypothetical protein
MTYCMVPRDIEDSTLPLPERLSRASALQGAIAFGLGISVFIARRPDILADPQLWAEDGRVWFQDAYNLGAT